MAFITVSNSKKIIRKLDEKNFANITEAIYKRDIYFFSKREDANLKGIRELFKDLENFLLSYYNPIVVVDSYRYVIPENQPAYHKDNTCERLVSKFLNHEVPEEIRRKGKDAVTEFRNKYNSQKFDREDGKDFILWLTREYPSVESIKPIDYGNSGIEIKINYSLFELENQIDELLNRCDRYFEENVNIRHLIHKYQKLTFLAYVDGGLKNNNSGLNDEDLKSFLKSYEENFKTPIKNLLIEYYKVKFNPEMEFKGTLLEKLGFRPCGTCLNNTNKIFTL